MRNKRAIATGVDTRDTMSVSTGRRWLVNQRRRYQVPLQLPSSQLSASVVAGLAIELLTVKLKSFLKLKRLIKTIPLT
jgi:hypothetical protein